MRCDFVFSFRDFGFGNTCEIEKYKKVSKLQGNVVLGVVASGPDNWFTEDGFVMITEKVREELTKTKDGLLIDDKKLGEVERFETGWKVLDELDAILACGVVLRTSGFAA